MRMGEKDLLVKVLALVFPTVLFVFKYILPSIAEAAYKNTKREKKQMKIELIHFPVDLLFVAISYTIPQIIEVTSELSLMGKADNIDLNYYQDCWAAFILYFSLSILILLLVPFYVFGSKIAEKYYFSKNFRGMLFILIPSYAFVIFLIWLSIFY